MPDIDRSMIPVPSKLRGQRVIVRPYQLADGSLRTTLIYGLIPTDSAWPGVETGGH